MYNISYPRIPSQIPNIIIINFIKYRLLHIIVSRLCTMKIAKTVKITKVVDIFKMKQKTYTQTIYIYIHIQSPIHTAGKAH